MPPQEVRAIAERRMFAKTIIDSDAFLDMPISAQVLYFHLSMRADDDGFINNPKKVQRMVGCNDDDFKLLMAKRFVIVFDSGVIVIKHWKIHNYIRKDRYSETVYQEEKNLLVEKENGSYSLLNPKVYDVGLPLVNQPDTQRLTQVRLGKDRLELGKDSIGNTDVRPSKRKYGEYQHVSLTDEEQNRFVCEFGQATFDKCIKILDEYCETSGKRYKNYNLVMRGWVLQRAGESKKGNSFADDIAEIIAESEGY